MRVQPAATDHPADYGACRVRRDGSVEWTRQHFRLAEVPAEATIGLERLEVGDWRVHYGPLVLGTVTHRGRFKTKR